jgi:hypothetical protein
VAIPVRFSHGRGVRKQQVHFNDLPVSGRAVAHSMIVRAEDSAEVSAGRVRYRGHRASRGSACRFPDGSSRAGPPPTATLRMAQQRTRTSLLEIGEIASPTRFPTGPPRAICLNSGGKMKSPTPRKECEKWGALLDSFRRLLGDVEGRFTHDSRARISDDDGIRRSSRPRQRLKPFALTGHEPDREVRSLVRAG